MGLFTRKPKIEATAGELITFTADPFDIEAASDKSSKPATFEAEGYSGGVMTVGGHGEIVVDLSGMEIPSKVTILADHENRLEAVAGHGSARVESGRLLVAGEIVRDSRAGQMVIGLARGGVSLQASIGAMAIESRFIRRGESVKANGQTFKAGPRGLKLITKSKLRELTVTPLGADDKTSVAVAATQGTDSMPTEIQAQEDLQAERERVAGIIKATEGVINVEASTLQGIRNQAIESGATVADVNSQVLELVRGSRPAPIFANGSGFESGPAIHSKSGLPDSGLPGIEAALLIRAGHTKIAEEEYGDRVLDGMRGMERASFPDVMATALRCTGEQVPHGRDSMIRAALSNHAVTTALGNAANLSVVGPFMEAKRTFPAFAAQKSANDFKTHTGIRFVDGFNLEPVTPGGDLKHGDANESTYPYAVDTFGKLFSIDRKDMINDSVSIFDSVAPAMGRAAARMESDVFYNTLFAADSSYFDVALGNLGTGAFHLDNLTAAIGAMMGQRSATGDDLDISPAVLLVGPSLAAYAKSVLQSEYVQRMTDAVDNMPTGNPARNAVTLLVDSRLENTEKFGAAATSTLWHLFASPADAPMIYAYLNGRSHPIVEFFGLDKDPNKLAVTWRVYHDFGAALAEYRGAYRSTGTGS